MPQRLLREMFVALRAGIVALVFCIALLPSLARAQATRPAAAPASQPVAPGRAGRYDGLPVRSVKVIGNTRTDAAVILAQARTQPGLPYSEAILHEDTKAISSLDLFASVEAQLTPVTNPQTGAPVGVDVQFVVVEPALVTAVEITGNRKFSDADIREHLIVRPGTAYSKYSQDLDRKYILELYKKKGYDQVSVDVDEALVLRQGIVRYQIIEGPLTQISAVNILGNHALSSSYIKWRIQTKTAFWIFRKGILEDEKLDQDVAAIRDMYDRKGYIDARVRYTLDYSEDKSKVVVTFIVLEGLQYKISKINFTGNTVFSNAELLGDPRRFGPGSVAEREKIDLLQKHIEDAYGHEGYVYSTVEIDKAFTEAPGYVDLNIKITEGKPYVVGRIIIRGNQNTQDRVIRRQIRIYPDQTFDMVLVNKSIERLKATRIVTDVKIRHIQSPGNPEGVEDALVEVAEGQSGRFSFGAGVSTNSGLVGQVSLEQQNFDILNWPKSLDEFIRGQSFKGAGQYFRLLLEPGTEFQRYLVTFQEPYLFDTPYSFTNDLYFFTRARESWDERRIGDKVTFGRRFGDIWSLSLAFRAEQVTVSNPHDIFNDRITQTHQPVIGPNGHVTYFNDTAQEILNEEGSTFLTSIKPAVARDTTDSATFPTTGTRMALSLEQYGAMGGSVDMTRIVLDYNWYYTLHTDVFDRKTVLSVRNEVGLIPWGDSPTFERFYLGGIGELRGFKYRGISPRSGPLNDPIGGNFDWFTSVEVNFPIYEDLLRGVVFVDVGTVESDITIGQIRSDIGMGIRLKLPIFNELPIALDFAYPTTKQNNDETQLISVALGIPF